MIFFKTLKQIAYYKGARNWYFLTLGFKNQLSLPTNSVKLNGHFQSRFAPTVFLSLSCSFFWNVSNLGFLASSTAVCINKLQCVSECRWSVTAAIFYENLCVGAELKIVAYSRWLLILGGHLHRLDCNLTSYINGSIFG